MLARLLGFCLLGMVLTACVNSPDMNIPWTTSSANSVAPANTPTQVKEVALLLPQQGDYASAAKAIQEGFNAAYQQSNNKPIIKIYDTSQGESIDALYDSAVKNGANFVIGPLEKTNVASLQNHDTNVITIALNSGNSVNTNPNYYQYSLSPTDEAKQIADKAAQEGHHAALLITPAGAWGNNIASALQTEWQSDGGTIVGSMSVNKSTKLNDQIRQLLEVNGNSRRQDFDSIFLITQPMVGREIKPLLKFYYTDNIPVYSTSLIYTGIINTSQDVDLNGIEFCDMPLVLNQNGYWQNVREQFSVNQPGTSQQYIRLYGMGWDAALMTQNFNQVKSNGLNGATGQLSVGSQDQIHRQLSFATFSGGMPVVHS